VQYLYSHFRPPIVKANPVPLSSDACSPFGKFAALTSKDNQDIVEATDLLTDKIIPKFAKELLLHFRPASLNNTVLDLPISFVEVMNFFHLHGINYRYLGLVRHYSEVEWMRKLLLAIMITRTLKNKMREQLRNVNEEEEGKYKVRMRFKKY
jgi:hypothetical protein